MSTEYERNLISSEFAKKKKNRNHREEMSWIKKKKEEFPRKIAPNWIMGNLINIFEVLQPSKREKKSPVISLTKALKCKL